MLRAVHGNRVEDLLAGLLEVLPSADPFTPSTIIVGSHLVARWLTREIALARGIAAGLDLVRFDAFVERTWTSDGPEARIEALDRKRLGAAFASVLADGELVSRMPAVAAYLAAAPAPGDRAGPRRVQLAEHLATLTWSYALSRPDWMPALIAGQVPNELAQDPTAAWQAPLIGAAVSRLPRDRRWAPTPMLPWLRRRAGLSAPTLATPTFVFGMSFFARSQLEALSDLAATSEVVAFVLDPCRELWDDVDGRGAVDRTTDPLPLVLWGRPVRDTLGALIERTGGDLEDRFSSSGDRTGDSARERLLADVRDRGVPSSGAGAAGVTVLACPNARREIEVIAAEIRRRLDADPTLRAHDIAVWIAGEAEAYLAQAPSAFEAVGVPCHQIDAPIDDRGRIGEAVLAILELPTSGMARRDLLRVMTHPAVLAGHPHVDAADWVRWTERLGIVHGADASAHDGTYLAEHPGHFHWDQGVRRLALGAFMVGERAHRGAARIAGMPVAPEELRPDQQASAATFALLVRSLCADAAWLATYEAPFTRWAEVLAALVDDYLAPRDEEATRDLERVRSLLAGLAQLDVDGRVLGFREVREHVIRQLAAARSNRGEPLAAGVMIAPLVAMRALPFRTVFVAGLDEGAFPAGDQPSPLDLRREMRAGDVSPRDRDRAAFLDVLLCARDALYLSYVAVEPKSGQPLGPSSVVLELGDALAPYLGAPSSREALAQITVRHPLHRFGGAEGSPVISRERWACTVRDRLRAHLRASGHPIPDEDGQLALLADPSQTELRVALGILAERGDAGRRWEGEGGGEPGVARARREEIDAPVAPVQTTSRSLTISNLRGFLDSPIQAWAQAVLGLDELPDDEAAQHSDEPFHLGRPERATVLREVLAAFLRDPGRPLEDRYDEAVAELALRGQFPVGVFAEAERTIDLATLATWRAGLGLLAVDSATRFGFGRAHSPGAELLPALAIELATNRVVRITGQTEQLLRDGTRFVSIIPTLRTIDKRSSYHLRGAFDHVLLAAAGLAPAGHVHKLLDPEGKVLEIRHEPWTSDDARAYLATLARELLDEPHGYVLPFDALAKALSGGKPSLKPGAPTNSLGFGPIERKDGLALPADASAMAQRRLRPLVDRMRGDHGFEVAK
jgi:exodeoxyribonuclease V gamma subunit